MLKLIKIGAISLLFSASALAAKAETLTEALAYAYSNNPSIASSFLSVRAAREAVRMAEGARLPTIGGTASINSVWQNGGGMTTHSFSDQLGVRYDQTLFDNNKSAAAILAAEASYDAAVQGARNTEQNVLLSVVQAYMNVVSNGRIVQIRRENVGFVRAQLQSARDRLELGEGTRLDVAQAEASLAQAEAAYQAAINNLRISEANYERWVGRAPRNLTGGYNFGNIVPASVDRAMAQAMAQHPALLASNAQIRAAQHKADETVAQFGPSLSLTGSAGVGGFTSGTVGTEVRVGLSLSVPIFTPSRDPAIEQANIGQIQSQLEAFVTRDQIVEAVSQSWAGLQNATSQIESATAAVAASRLALQAVIDQNEVGQATTLDVLTARANLLNVEEALVSAQSQRVVAAYSLIASSGSLSAQSLGLPGQPRSADGSAIVPATVAPSTDAWGNLR